MTNSMSKEIFFADSEPFYGRPSVNGKSNIDVRVTNKYVRTVKGVQMDVYDVLKAWKVTNPAIQHAVKKLLQAGDRGHKDKLTDLNEAIESILRAIELEE